MPPPVLKDGEVVSSRYRVAGNKPIGAGQFAEVFRALDQTSDQRSPTFVAIKIEREEKTTSREVRALQDLQGCPGVCRLLGQGSHRNQHPFIVMQLGGENLADIRHTRVAERRHSKSTIAWIGVRVLDTLRAIHARGYVHRDVKPSNITVAPRGSGAGSGTRELLLIDLGLAKKFETKEAREASARDREEGEAADERVAFRGSTTYASVNAHAGIEQGPRDDLWSLLYALAEMHEGTLPWRGLKDKGAADDESVKRGTHDLKKKALAEPDDAVSDAGHARCAGAFLETPRTRRQRARRTRLRSSALDSAKLGRPTAGLGSERRRRRLRGDRERRGAGELRGGGGK
jgi:tau tubulin kinase